MRRRDALRAILGSGPALAAMFSVRAAHATTTNGAIATVHPLATQAGVTALESGGNAIDAAVAAALALGVVDGYNSGIGGGCFFLARLSAGRFVAIDGRETAPARAHRDMYLREGKPQPELSQTGPLAVGTPGALAAYAHAVREHGRLNLSDLLGPAAELADRGFVISAAYARQLAKESAALSRFEGSRSALFKANGAPYAAGETLRQPDLAATYRAIAAGGTDWFYRGPLARAVGDWMAAHGGLLSADDFAAYRAHLREPLVTAYRGHSVVGFPPPSSGGVHVAQILNMLETFDVADAHRRDPARFYHVIAEAMKRAFADRAHWLGDPDFASVPRGLASKAYAAELARQIDPDRATPVEGHGDPPGWQEDVFGGSQARKHTTHVAAADGEGNWVALTTTVNTTFGSKVIVPGTGVVLNNQMDDFSIAPGVPNAFGLLGNEANAVAPGKRPLSSMSPTIVLRDGQPFLTVGAAGGPTIISQVVLALVYRLDLGWDAARAVAAPRIHHQWRPDELRAERSLDQRVAARLETLGHRLHLAETIGVAQAVAVEPDGRLTGVADPRAGGKAQAT